jgi:23S rRNA (guanosine2251-2'-O)-methyltransferase
MAALGEYLRFKPESVVEVASAPQFKRDVEARLKQSGVTIAVRDIPKPAPGDDRTSPVTARVMVKTLEWHEMLARMDKREPRSPEIVLALDHITDPRNLGAIVRSAAFFGVTEVIVPERRQVLLTQASVGTAQGGFALADLVCVVNLGRAIDELKERGFWAIGADMNGEPFTKLTREYQKTILVLGAEDTGISDGVRKKCDRIASIPGRDPGLESLNVSVAAGVMLAAFASLN